MAYFATLRERVSTYVSPARTERKHATSSSVTTTSLEQRLDRRSMSPATRTKIWLTRYTPSSESTSARTPSVLGVQGSKVSKGGLAKPATNSLAATKGRGGRYWGIRLLPEKVINKKDEDEDYTEDVEGSTLLEDDSEDAPQQSASSSDVDELANDTTLVEEQDDDDDDESSGEARDLNHGEKGEYLVNMARERAKREKALTQITKGEWSEAEIALFQKLNMRGFEPLLPENWMMDFKTIPESLFTDKDEEVFINSVCGRDFRATKALASLLSLGVRVRDKIVTSHPPEEIMRREIESYIKWSERDGKLTTDQHIPVLAVATAKPGQSTQEVVDIVTEKLHALARRYRHKWRIHNSVEASGSEDPAGEGKNDEYEHDLPTLYGMVISHTIVAFVSHNAAVPDTPVRSIALFDFGDDDHDVWNGFAVAILVVMVRNYLMGLQNFGSETKRGGERKRSDPDA